MAENKQKSGIVPFGSIPDFFASSAGQVEKNCVMDRFRVPPVLGMARGSGTRKGWGIDMTKENTDKEDDGGTGGDDAPGGDQAESGGTVGAADSHISDADSGTAGIADEMPERTLLMRRSPV